MMAMSDPLKKDVYYYGSKEGYDISVMTDCKAVVEKKGYVATGTLTYAAGEIIEIEFPQFDSFKLGEAVRIMVYSKGGIYVFDTTVIAKAQGALIIINPPENRKRFMDKRQHPRIDTRTTGKMLSMFETARKTERRFDEPIPFKLENISMAGAGFVTEIELPLAAQTELAIEVDLGFNFHCRMEIIHKKRIEDGLQFGTRLVHMSDDHASKLRAFILKSQIETYYKEKADKVQEALKKAHLKKPAAAQSDSNGGAVRTDDLIGSGDDLQRKFFISE
jgi:c-di-GMP-binding flagellar brake protein YcgR